MAAIPRLTRACQADRLSQIDLEWIGSDKAQVQSNYFSKGDTTTYDRGAYHPVADGVGKSHKYGIKWTSDAVTWSVDGNPVRTLKASDAKGGSAFPQTPMQVKLGTWCAGGKNAEEGTAKWAGGRTDFSQKPFVGIYKNIKIVDYAGKNEAANGGIKEYVYGDNTGSAKSIKVVEGKSDSKQVNGENGIKGGEGKENGSSSHNEAKTLLESDSSSSGAETATSLPRPTGTDGGDGEDQQPRTTMATVTGGSNSTATSRPSGSPNSAGNVTPTSAAGLGRRDVMSFGAVAVAAAVIAQLLL